ncbi:MAG: glycosyltransferase family 1 protein [Microbacteriaceae bacterium]|nr:glycosyltransferase family 1 protein [Microbacteriaceae bacterium]
MKLFFDARYIRADFHDGISRYSTELANAVAEIAQVTFLICDENQKRFLPDGADTLQIHAPTSPKEPFTARILNKYGPDVVFSPMQTIGSSGRRFKLILTLHDMIYYRHRTPPRHLPWPIRLGWRLYHLSYAPQRAKLNGADVVATVSETSKRDFAKAQLTKRPVVVIPNAPQKLAELLERPVRDKSSKNLVYMGSFMEYKNVETLIAGLAHLPADYTLHLLSRVSEARKAQLEALVPKGANVVFHNGVSDVEYAELLADNAILVTGSLDEGYGLPLAEALALGVPAVVSELPIFHEVAGHGALYFEAQNPREFAAAVLKVSEPGVREELVVRGKEHMAQFSWAKSAQILLETAKKLHKTVK